MIMLMLMIMVVHPVSVDTIGYFNIRVQFRFLTDLSSPLPGHLLLAVGSRLVEVAGGADGLVHHGVGLWRGDTFITYATVTPNARVNGFH